MTNRRISRAASPSFASGSRPPALGWRLAGASLMALALAACTQQEAVVPAVADDMADSATLGPVLVNEAFATPMTPDDNIDSVASWSSPDGDVLVLATAKSTHRLVVYDGFTGEFVRHVGEPGVGRGEFDRPNGIAVADDLAFVVERDNRRVQVLQLPGMETVAMFGSDVLELPYGLWVHAVGDGYELYVTDAIWPAKTRRAKTSCRRFRSWIGGCTALPSIPKRETPVRDILARPATPLPKGRCGWWSRCGATPITTACWWPRKTKPIPTNSRCTTWKAGSPVSW